ncbi:MAG: hypothetical protein L0H37_01165 [Nitrosospira sp.]|nr:hypothetical protein [Nitrosospira sp.]
MSRSPTPHPLGKCDAEVKVALPEQVRDKVCAMAALDGQTTSEYLRDVICKQLFGEWNMLQMLRRQNRNGRAE